MVTSVLQFTKELVGQQTTSSGKILHQGTEYISDTGSDTMVSRDVIEYEGESIIFKPELMEKSKPYPFTFLGHPVFVVKRGDGTLDFYYLPERD